MTDPVRVELTSWNRFNASNLAVAPELLGRSHIFDVGGHTVRISLPGADTLPEDYTPDERVIGDRLSISGWQSTKDGEYQPLEVHVDDVDVVVSIPGEHAVRKAVFSEPVNAYDLVEGMGRDRVSKASEDTKWS